MFDFNYGQFRADVLEKTEIFTSDNEIEEATGVNIRTFLELRKRKLNPDWRVPTLRNFILLCNFMNYNPSKYFLDSEKIVENIQIQALNKIGTFYNISFEKGKNSLIIITHPNITFVKVQIDGQLMIVNYVQLVEKLKITEQINHTFSYRLSLISPKPKDFSVITADDDNFLIRKKITEETGFEFKTHLPEQPKEDDYEKSSYGFYLHDLNNYRLKTRNIIQSVILINF